MDVPEMILYGTTLVSPGTPVKLEASVHAARMLTPGATSFGITVPTAPALIAPTPSVNSSQSTILPVTRDLFKEPS
ncbi:hypothetical protein PVL29_016732 [Vitis rotundifolia]|uniref:Uncharacterized protein n=1 Tax=Vitis rotundifolia TaxID=103349 RepID=A0AA39DHS3_VITRO|nr:hypothetical protein PVL29_016732 [Vitis rotundifolia]